MTEANLPVHSPISSLALRVTFPADGRDNPTLSIFVDGTELSKLGGSEPAFGGFSAGEMLGEPIPVVSQSGAWIDSPTTFVSPLARGAGVRRVAAYQCSCEIAGCGVIAPVIESNGAVVTWSDFRDYTGVFTAPDHHGNMGEGRRLGLRALTFEAEQYDTEISRIVADRSWESPSRVTARILRAMLLEHDQLLHTAQRQLAGVSFAWWQDTAGRFEILLKAPQRNKEGWPVSYFVGVTAKFGTPTSRAQSIVDRLLAVPVQEWHLRFPARQAN